MFELPGPTFYLSPYEEDLEVPDEVPQAPRRLWATLNRPVSLRRTLAVLVLFAAGVMGLVGRQPSDWVAYNPGPAPLIEFTDTGIEEVDPEFGAFHFTTARVDRISWLDYWKARAFGDSESIRRSAAQPQQDAAARSAAVKEMDGSLRSAWAVATALLGRGAAPVPFAADVLQVLPDTPAEQAGFLPGDRIVAVDGAPVSSAAELSEVIAASDGAELTVTVERRNVPDSEPATQELTLSPAEIDGAWRIGVQVTDAATLADPELDIDVTGVGGPSAGMLFTLAYLDALSEGPLTGGLVVSGSGTINLDGTVGPVGAISHKVEGALTAGADVFFVPAVEEVDARHAARGRIEVVGVETVMDAVRWLCDNGAAGQVCELAASGSPDGDAADEGDAPDSGADAPAPGKQ